MPTKRALSRLGAHADGPRRLRDLIRSLIHHGEFPGGELPSETEMMVRFGAPRSVVREALDLLRSEGLINRVQGVGTFVLSAPTPRQLLEIHGVASEEHRAAMRVSPHLLDTDVIPTPEPVAARLGRDASPTCARIEYVAVFHKQSLALATNYVLFPEAEVLRATPFDTDWYTYLRNAGLRCASTEFLIGAHAADAPTAHVLGIAEGAPLMYLEQVIENQAGRRYNFAIIQSRGDSMLLSSRAARQLAE